MQLYPVLPREEVLASLPAPPEPTSLPKEIRRLQASQKLPILVVLDDDPTGTQTCHDINVLTVWDRQTLVDEFTTTQSGFFILTNSRALPTPAARELIRTICEAVKSAAEVVGKPFEFVLRGDSTLRGHFPDEVEVAQEVTGRNDTCILAPFFRQGGRLTINDVHYVADGKSLVPAAQTPFAKDATFGYKNSNLKDYVVEKSKGSIQESAIDSVSLDDIRVGGPTVVAKKLLATTASVIIVNAVVDADMEIFVQGMLEAQLSGKRFVYRTGAAFVSTRLGIQQIPPLGPKELNMDLSPAAPGGLIIAGSYVPKTTAQLESLIQGRGDHLNTIVIQVEDLLANPSKSQETVLAAADKAGELIVQGKDVLLMTSRRLITAKDAVSSLKTGTTVAQALVDFLRLVNPRPRYVIAKVRAILSSGSEYVLTFDRAE